MTTYRTFIKDINCNFSLPIHKNRRKVVIICPGLPSSPENFEIMEWLSKNGYYCIHPKYSGTWESYGNFLRKSPVKDILRVINFIKRNKYLYDCYNEKRIPLHFTDFILVGSSFGGSVALVAGSKAKEINKIIAIAPIVDFSQHRKNKNLEEQDLERLFKFIRKAYGRAYILKLSDYRKLIQGKVDINPIDYIDKLKSKKIIIIHGTKDRVVSIKRTKDFFKKIESQNKKFYELKNKEHLSLSKLDRKILRRIFF